MERLRGRSDYFLCSRIERDRDKVRDCDGEEDKRGARVARAAKRARRV